VRWYWFGNIQWWQFRRRHELVKQFGKPQRMTVSRESYLEILNMVGNPPEPTKKLRRLFEGRKDDYDGNV